MSNPKSFKEYALTRIVEYLKERDKLIEELNYITNKYFCNDCGVHIEYRERSIECEECEITYHSYCNENDKYITENNWGFFCMKCIHRCYRCNKKITSAYEEADEYCCSECFKDEIFCKTCLLNEIPTTGIIHEVCDEID